MRNRTGRGGQRSVYAQENIIHSDSAAAMAKSRVRLRPPRTFAGLGDMWGDIVNVSLPECSNQGKVFDRESYTLGYVYGDGTFSNKGTSAEITFCTEESKKCLEVMRNAPRLSSINENDSRGYKRAFFHTDINYWGSRSKEVFPTEMYNRKFDQITSFVAGLFDADGNWDVSQNRIRLASKHEGFLQGVSRLLEQIGILSGVTKAGFSTYGKAQTYQLVIMSDYIKEFARLVPTIRIKPKLTTYKSYRSSTIKVLSVESIGYAPVYCCDVGVEEHRG